LICELFRCGVREKKKRELSTAVRANVVNKKRKNEKIYSLMSFSPLCCREDNRREVKNKR